MKKKKQNITVDKQKLTDAGISINKEKFRHCILLAILVFVAYFNSLNNGYVLDDSLFITGNNFTLKGLEGIKEIWTNDAFVGAHGRAFDLEGGRYRPLSITMFAIEYHIWGLNPFPGHLINIIFFALSAIVIYLFLLRLFNSFNSLIPLLTTIIFIIHPVHTEVIANIKSRDEILSLFFLILSLYYYLPVIRNNTKGFVQYLLPALFFLLSLLSKENTITALAIVPVMVLFFSNGTIKTSIIKTVPYVLTSLIYLALRAKYAGLFGEREAVNVMDSPYLYATISEKYATILFVCGKYLSLFFWPWPLSYDYSYNAIPYTSWANFKVLLSLLAYSFVIAFSLKILLTVIKQNQQNSSFQLKKIIAFGLIFYISGFSIISNLFFNIGAPMGERFLYMPSLGLCISAAALITLIFKIDFASDIKYKKLIIPIILITPLALYGTITRNKAWKDNYTLYETDIKTVPNSARARMFYGIELLGKYYKNKNEASLEAAIREMEEACKINPKFYHAFYNLGLAYQAKKDHSSAVKAFEQVLTIEPKHINAHYYLAMSLAEGFAQYSRAIELMEKAIKVGYESDDMYVNLGISYAMNNDYTGAISAFERGISITPNNAQLYFNAAITYERLGNSTKSNEYFNKAYQLNPSLKPQP